MMNLQDRSVLVTGANGFLGSVLLNHLRQRAMRVIGTSLSSKGVEPFVKLDLESFSALTRFATYGTFDTIVHLAAVLPGLGDDLDMLIANQKMTYSILRWAVQSNTRYFLFASSCSVYGYTSVPCDETSPLAPSNLYAISKIACEQLVDLLTHDAGMRACVLRISAPYGPGLKRETVIKRFLTQAAHGQCITLMGTGSRCQDFVYEEDVAQAFFLARLHQAQGTFNISGGCPVSMRELAEMALHIFDRDVEQGIRYEGIDPQENYRGHFLFTAASQTFGYQPQISLEEGLRRSAQAWGLL